MRGLLARLLARVSASLPMLMPFARWPAWPLRRSSTRWLRAAAARALRDARTRPERRDWAALSGRLWPILASAPFAVAVLAGAVSFAALAGTLLSVEVGPSDLATSTLWAVQGAVIAFSLSLTLFAYQILPSEWAARHDLSLVAAFPAALRLGFAVLAITGVGLVFAPGDFSDLMRWTAFISSAVWGILLLFTFTQVAKIRNADHRLALRRADLRRTTLLTLQAQLLDRAGVNILRGRLDRSHCTFSPWISPHATDAEAQLYRAGLTGTVVDVDMLALDQACLATRDAGAVLEVAVRLGQAVSGETLLARAGAAFPARARAHLRRVFVIAASAR